jgi:hypothetical protein
MAKFNFNKPILKLDGQPFVNPSTNEEMNLSEEVGSLLARQRKSDDPLKLYIWATKLHQKDEIELDKSDIEKVKKIIKSDELTSALIQAQMLEVFIDKD